MANDNFPISLKNWQACLAVAQQRLANPSLRLEIQQSIDSPLGSASINGQAIGLTVQVMDTGKDLIKLGMTLEGDLKAAGRTIQVTRGALEVITSFETVLKDGVYSVLPKLDDRELAVNFNAEGLTIDEEAVIMAILKQWVADRVQANPFQLFSFNANTGQGAGAQFAEFKVTSAYAKYSPEYSSFLLLMRESQGGDVENNLVIEPHILPQAQTAVLWVTHDLLEKTGGAALVQEAEQELTFRPRPMKVNIPQVSDPLRCWSQTIIDNVSIPGGFDFTSMEMKQLGLMLSATPLSLDEFDAFTARDITKDPDDLVQKEAEKLFRDCIFYYAKDEYRKYLIQEERPVLPKEIMTVTMPYVEWLEKFARLQIAQAITNSDASKQEPFNKLEKDKVAEKLKEMSSSSTYADITGKLYSLAFCVLHPRISLYMEDPNAWKDPFFQRITSKEYSEYLMNEENPALKIHEAVSKLTVFDLSGETSKTAQKEVINRFAQTVAIEKWQIFVKEMPDQVQAAIETGLQQIYLVASKETGEGSSDQSNQDVKDAIEAAGGVSGLAARIMVDLRTAAIAEGYVPLEGALNRIDQLWINHPQAMALGVGIVKFVACIAVLAVFFHGCKDALTMEGLSPEQQVKKVCDFAVSLVATIWAAGELVSSLSETFAYFLPNFADRIAQGLRILVTQLPGRLARGAARLANNATKIFKVAGSALAIACAALAVWDAIDDFKDGKVGAGVVDTLLAITAGLEAAAIIFSWSGPVAIVLAVVGVILTLIRIFAFRDDEAEAAQDAANNLGRQLAADGVTA